MIFMAGKMDIDACPLCFQPLAHCGGRSDRRAETVEMIMMAGFGNAVVIIFDIWI